MAGGYQMDKREKSLQEEMQELKAKIGSLPEEKQKELRSYICGYMAALKQMQQQDKTA
jgi:ribosomal protein S17E